MLSYIKKYPISLFIILTVIYLSFFKPPKTDLNEIPNLDKLVHICMYFGMSGMLWRGGADARILYHLSWRRLAGLCSQQYRGYSGQPGSLLWGKTENEK